MKKFRINNFLTLKLEKGKTNIYVNDERFAHCKSLNLNIYINVEYGVTPETEFWGHCSSLQAWYEHDYDMLLIRDYDIELIHSNFFWLLKKLVEIGDPIANKAIKSGALKPYLLSSLDRDEFRDFFPEISDLLLPAFFLKAHIYEWIDVVYLIGRCKESGLLEEYRARFLEIINKINDVGVKLDISYYLLISLSIEKQWVREQSLRTFLEQFDILPQDFKEAILPTLFQALKLRFDQEKIFNYLKIIGKTRIENRFEAFYDLLGIVRDTSGEKKKCVSTFLAIINYDMNESGKGEIFSSIFTILNELGFLKEYFLKFVELTDKMSDDELMFISTDLLRNIVKKEGWWLEEEIVSTFFNRFNKLPPCSQDFVFEDFFYLLYFRPQRERPDQAKIEWYLQIIDKFSGKLKFKAYLNLLELIKDLSVVRREYFLVFFRVIEQIDIMDKYIAFYELLDAMNALEVKIEHYSVQIEDSFYKLVKNYDVVSEKEKYSVFYWLLKLAKISYFKKKYLNDLMEIFLILPDSDKFKHIFKEKAFSDLIRVIKRVNLENETAVRRWKEKNNVDAVLKVKKDRHKRLYGFAPSSKYEELSSEQAERRQPLEKEDPKDYKPLDKF